MLLVSWCNITGMPSSTTPSAPEAVEFLILGGGLAGIACSYYIGHQRCYVVEKSDYLGGHIHSYDKNGFTWDEGPHVSFTNHPIAKAEFAASCEQDYLEYPVQATNYYKSRWIPHPAQSNLYAADEQTRAACLEEFLQSRAAATPEATPADYGEWTQLAFGPGFRQNLQRRLHPKILDHGAGKADL